MAQGLHHCRGSAHGALNISDDDLFALPVPLPAGDEMLAEQQKIADCLGSLDDLITAEGRKLEALRDHKKGLMQQLFPREGETQPRLRFPEFRDAEEWEPRKLGDVISLEYGKSLPTAERRGGPVPVLGSNGVVGWHDEAVVEGPAIVVGRKGSAGEVTWIEDDCFPIDTTYYVRAKETRGDVFAFLHRLLDTLDLPCLADMAAVPGLNRTQAHSLLLTVPQSAEQQRIADCLSALDSQIDAQAEKLAALRTHKRGLMQQLFPSQEPTTGGSA